MTLSEQRDQLVRIIVGAMLLHAREKGDIAAFCSLLANDRSIGVDVSKQLSLMLGSESNGASRKGSAIESASGSGAVERIFAEVLNSGVSKRVCLDAMKKSNPGFVAPSGVDKMSLRDLLRRFVNQSSPTHLTKFVNYILASDVDPYLRRM